MQSIGDDETIVAPNTTQHHSNNRETDKQENCEKKDINNDTNYDGWHIDDFDTQSNNDESSNKEDDENTIGSGTTTNVRRRNLNRINIPPYVRFQLMLPPALEDEEDENNIGYRDNYTRIRNIINTFVTQVRLFDEKAEIISWKSDKDFSFLPQGDLPENVAEIAKYFKGFRKRMRGDRRTYIKVGIHTSNSFAKLEEDLDGWADLYSYTLKRCLIQSNDAGYVGWICYTSQYTNTKQWREYLTTKTGYEWGFKMVPVTSTDKHIKWNQRLKAIGIYVPTQNTEEAKYEISHMLLQDEDKMGTSNSYQDRFVYVPLEDSIGDEPDTILAYQAFVQ